MYWLFYQRVSLFEQIYTRILSKMSTEITTGYILYTVLYDIICRQKFSCYGVRHIFHLMLANYAIHC